MDQRGYDLPDSLDGDTIDAICIEAYMDAMRSARVILISCVCVVIWISLIVFYFWF